MLTIRLPRPGRCPRHHESDKILVPAGWYEHSQSEMLAAFGKTGKYFAPRQIGVIEGGYDDATSPGMAVLFVRVMAVGEEDL